MINRYLQNGLQGKYAHYQTDMLFDGLSWEKAGEKPEGSPHSVWELLFHMNYWQDFILTELHEEKTESPEVEIMAKFSVSFKRKRIYRGGNPIFERLGKSDAASFQRFIGRRNRGKKKNARRFADGSHQSQ